ncbi:MAG: carboxypeptidase-like regulatory domain-containing protein [Saprospiraceae bacterium]|nr:carboxypeptidase-like regulatory domain-containing protein [Saprospiraceae bacterium]
MSVSAQESSLLKKEITLEFHENTLLGHVDKLLIQEDIIVAFNSSRVDLTELIILPNGPLKLEVIIRRLFYSHNIKVATTENKVIIAFLDERVSDRLTIKGYIRDLETGEALVGASIEDVEGNTSTFSNENGFYSLTLPSQSNRVLIKYLGYRSQEIKNVTSSSLNIKLEFDNEIDQIIIKGSISDNFIEGSGSEKIDLSLTEGFLSISGDNDLIEAVRKNPKVQSGNEGQVGLYVRGGSPDQNLILFDGIPLYEVSHTGGLSSIFIEESIKDADIITNGFPARYGGRLSSVMNVRLKEGNQSQMNGSVNVSLPAIKAHIEGPLFSPKTTFNISGRVSYVDKYINQLIGELTTYDNIDLNYHDFVGKITHRFTPTQKLSFSYYDGEDNLALQRTNTITDSLGNFFQTYANNGVSWGSSVWNLSFTNVVADKLQLTANVGGIKYRNQSRAVFAIDSKVEGLSRSQELELRSLSQIEDQMVGLNFDYYLSDRHRLKFGGNWIHHEYNPSIIGSDTISQDGNIIVTSEESLIIADELAFYVEDTYRPHKNWQIYGGIHFSGYNIGDQQYRNTQPRFSTVFTPDSFNRFSVSYSNMIQYIHLLVNPGIGIPSDLWVPSTELVRPESARQFSFAYNRKINKAIEFSLSGFTKSFNDVLDYKTSVDLFFTVVNSVVPPSIQTDPDWQNNVIPGKSNASGLEFQLRKNKGTWTGWISYALSKTDRQFEDINDGEKFAYKYDRRHDINIGIKYELNEHCSFSTNWVYGSGNAFSLADEQILTPFDGVSLVNAGQRNNYRFPSFSHLDIQFNYEKELKYGKFKFNLGLYNAYNRKNAYYIYVYSSPIVRDYIAYKTSIFPILPNMNLGYSF